MQAISSSKNLLRLAALRLLLAITAPPSGLYRCRAAQGCHSGLLAQAKPSSGSCSLCMAWPRRLRRPIQKRCHSQHICSLIMRPLHVSVRAKRHFERHSVNVVQILENEPFPRTSLAPCNYACEAISSNWPKEDKVCADRRK